MGLLVTLLNPTQKMDRDDYEDLSGPRGGAHCVPECIPKVPLYSELKDSYLIDIVGFTVFNDALVRKLDSPRAPRFPYCNR
jgi:hypothetical protein